MYNKVTLLGRITNDLELKTTPAGVSVLTFGIAVDRRYQEQGKEKKTDFFNCVAWRNEAEFISKFWAKGRAILVEGELQNRKYTDKSGTERQITEIIVDRACFTGEKTQREAPPLPDAPPEHGKKETASSGTPESAQQYTAEDFTAAANPGGDDYPF